MTAANYQAIDPWVLWDVAAGDREVFRTLAWIYLDQAPALARRIHEGQLRNAHAEVCSASHTLKGMAGLLGAAGLCSVLQQLEAAAREHLPQAPQAEQLEEVARLCAQVLREVVLCSEQFDGARPGEAR